MEDIIIAQLKKKDNVRLISEEAGELVFGTPEAIVITDPLDGSFNAKEGIPIFAISLALVIPDTNAADVTPTISDVRLGYIKNLISGDEYWAVRNGGAFKNGEKFTVPQGERFKIIGAELSPYPAEAYKRFLPLLGSNSRIRCIGSLALDLCFAAEGIFDCVLDLRNSLCRVLDISAGVLIMEEAGAVITDDSGKPLNDKTITTTESFNLVGARTKELHEKIIKVILKE